MPELDTDERGRTRIGQRVRATARRPDMEWPD